MSSSKYVNVSLQEQVPERVLRTGDDFSSESDNDDEPRENSEEFEDVEMDNGEEFETNGNSGWADAMAKILKTNTPEGQKSVVLAKAKKISDVLKKEKIPDLGFEIDGEIKEEKPGLDTIKKTTVAEMKQYSKQKKEWRLKGRIKPSILEKNRERTLSKIATKGVVQLFNTVRAHQKQLDRKLNEAGSVRKREKVLNSVNKQVFLDMLMGNTATKTLSKEAVKEEMKEEKGTWEVLRDDFMLEGNLKDWDKKLDSSNVTTEIKEEEEDEDTEGGSDGVSDDDSSDDG